MEQQRNFKGIWIPKEIWDSEELNILEKIILVEIDSLEDEEKGCWASNKHFANFFKLTNGRISQIISSLTEKGFINVEYERKGKEIIGRKIRINKPPYPLFNKLNTYLENYDGGIKKIKGGYLENYKENNTYINNTNINNKEKIYKKESYGIYGRIKLTTNEYNKLVKDFGEEYITKKIEQLDEYVESNNNKNKYSNFNLVLRKAIREKWFKDLPTWFDKPEQKQERDLTEDERELQDYINEIYNS